MSSPATPGRVAAWGLALFTLTRIIGVVFASASMAATVGQAIAAEWGAGRLHVTWSDPHEKLPSTGQIARRALLGAACGIGAALLLVSHDEEALGAFENRQDFADINRAVADTRR